MNLSNVFSEHNLILTPEQEAQFERINELFQDWNGKINLSALRTTEDIYLKHFVDSLLATHHFDFENKKVLDLGSGGGFPALPLSIATSAEITALDSVGKKLKAVQDIADRMKLNVTTLNGRAEELGHDKKYRQQFDIVTARAVAPWPILLELCLPFVKVGGEFIAYQGPAIQEDLEKYEDYEMKFKCEMVQIVETKLAEEERLFIEIEKIDPTPKKYPRPMQMIRKEFPRK